MFIAIASVAVFVSSPVWDVAALGSPSYRTREAAQSRLIARGDYSRPHLSPAKLWRDPEIRYRIKVVEDGIFNAISREWPHPANLFFVSNHYVPYAEQQISKPVLDKYYDFRTCSWELDLFVGLGTYGEPENFYVRYNSKFIYEYNKQGHYSATFVRSLYDRGVPSFVLKYWVEAALALEVKRKYRTCNIR